MRTSIRARWWGRRVWLTTAALALLAGASLAASASARIAVAPANATLPVVTGTAQQGHSLTAQSGSWTGSTPIVFAYQWRRCDAAGAACSDIAGATSQTYVLASADVGSTLRISVTATNADGTGKALSDASAVVSSQSAPVVTTAPAISGTAREGDMLTTSNGTWSGSTPITYSYQWQLCDVNGNACQAIAGATAQSYQVAAGEAGKTLRVSVKASNAGGSSTVLTGSSAVVAAQGTAPASTSVPTLSGTTTAGSALTVAQGAWSGTTPLTFAYGWQRCDVNGNNCATIAGAGSQSYTLVNADVANRVRGVVTASNDAGSTTAYSQLSGVIGSLAPVNTALPAISGGAALGQTLTATNGSWAGTTPLQFYPQWARGNAKGGYDPIVGATQSSYKVTSADIGHKLYVQVKAQNSHGAAWATSNPTAAVTGTATPRPAPGVVLVGSVSLPNRLVVSAVSFTPSVVRTRAPFQARFRVSDTQGHPVQGALVYALGLPYGWV